VTAEIVHDDDVAGLQGGPQNLLTIDRTREQPRRLDPVVAQRSQKGRGPPAAVRVLGDETAAPRRRSFNQKPN
jgi:hypothetical protein